MNESIVFAVVLFHVNSTVAPVDYWDKTEPQATKLMYSSSTVQYNVLQVLERLPLYSKR